MERDRLLQRTGVCFQMRGVVPQNVFVSGGCSYTTEDTLMVEIMQRKK